MLRICFRLAVAVLGFSVFGSAAVSTVSYNELVREFDYDQHETIDVEEQQIKQLPDGVQVYDVSYDSPKGGLVPAYMVVPAGRGPFPAVLWGHWMDYKTASRKEFLDEALVLAQSGLASLMIDAPFVRPGFVPDDDPLSPQYPLIQQQMVIDVRRGVDYLLSRGDIDSSRIAYVGHSFDAGIGGILAGVETRFKGLVIMAGRLNDNDYLTSDEPHVVAARKQLGADRLEKLLSEYPWTNPYYYLREPGESELLLQYGSRDWFVSPKVVESYMEFIEHPKDLRFYDSNHELNKTARQDRAGWLKKLLDLGEIDRKALARLKIPD